VEWHLLRGLTEAEIEQVLSLGRPRKFGRREVIWHEGDRAEMVHLIREGRIAIRAMTPLGEVATIAIVGPGEAVGLIAVHVTEPFHTATALALEPAETVAIWMQDFTTIRRRLPALDEAVIHFLADRVVDLSGQLVDALYVPADARVLRRLVALSGLYDRGEGEIHIPLTQEDLAELAGVTRPTVNRVLKKEEQRGTLRISRGSIFIANVGDLAARAK
jgi:CRP/FNR family cyclic AMP-dependent transcriptional regulator